MNDTTLANLNPNTPPPDALIPALISAGYYDINDVTPGMGCLGYTSAGRQAIEDAKARVEEKTQKQRRERQQGDDDGMGW